VSPYRNRNVSNIRDPVYEPMFAESPPPKYAPGEGGIVQNVTELENQSGNVAANKNMRLPETDIIGLLGVHSVHVHTAPNRCKIWEAPTKVMDNYFKNYLP